MRLTFVNMFQFFLSYIETITVYKKNRIHWSVAQMDCMNKRLTTEVDNIYVCEADHGHKDIID